jgi:hypothetical protein
MAFDCPSCAKVADVPIIKAHKHTKILNSFRLMFFVFFEVVVDIRISAGSDAVLHRNR